MQVNNRKKSVEIMQNISANKPLKVTQEATEANEKLTGLYSIGKIIGEFGYRKIVPKEPRSQVPARNNCSTVVAGRCAA
jgi:hypothetical protein